MTKFRVLKLVSTDSFHMTISPWRIGQTQLEEAEEDLHALFPNNPFVPPKYDVCFVNNLPPEVLSRIFEDGSADDDSEDEDDVGADFWDNRHYNLSDANEADGNDTHRDDSPVEMQEEIEDEGEGEGDKEGTDATGSSDFPPPGLSFQIIVSHVCRHWRNVALSTPSLWTTIEVTPEARPPYGPVSAWLERSKGLPVDIYVNCERSRRGVQLPSDTDLEFLFSLFSPHIHRWRTMEILVSDYRHLYVFLSVVSDPSVPAPQLTVLEFDSFGYTYPGMLKRLALVGGSAPLLTGLVLCGVHVDWNQPWIASASNLTHLELAFHLEDLRLSWARFAAILRGAPALERLSLRLSGPCGDPQEWFIEPTPGSPADLNSPVQFPRVTHLTLAFHSQARAIGLLHKFYLPAIKHLVLEFNNGDYTEFVHELAKPATSPSLNSAQEKPCSLLRNLETLKIAGLPCRTECLQKLYGELQNLTSLDINFWSPHPEDPLSLLGSPGIGRHEIWLPRLVTLYVPWTSSDVLREIVQRRKDAGVPLDSLYVKDSYGAYSDEDVVWLKENLKMFELLEESDDWRR